MRRHIAIAMGIAFLCWIAVSASIFLFVWTNASLPDVYSENIGYRFFWTMRWVDGARDDFIHIGQGVLLPMVQALYFIAAKKLAVDLWGEINLFAQMTMVGPVILTALLMSGIAADRRLPLEVKALLLLSPVVMALSHQHTFLYHLYPDYAAYEKVLFTGIFWFVIRNFVYATPRDIDALWLGVAAGAAAALKINLGIVVLGLVWIAPQRPFRLAIYGSLTAAYYGGNLEWVARYFRELFAFSGAGADFPWADLSPLGSWRENTMSNLGTALVIIVISAIYLFARDRLVRIPLVCSALAGLVLLMAVRRGGGASYFDAFMISVLLLALMGSGPTSDRRLARAIIFLFLIGPMIFVGMSWATVSTNSGKIVAKTNWQRQLTQWNDSKNLPIVSIFPSNSFVYGSIEDMMMRGFSNFAEVWYDSNENHSRQLLFPRNVFAPNNPPVPIHGPFVMEWIEATGPSILVSDDDAKKHNAAMNALVAAFTIRECTAVRPPRTQIIFHACVMSAPA
jgi:hypothetical protein